MAGRLTDFLMYADIHNRCGKKERTSRGVGQSTREKYPFQKLYFFHGYNTVEDSLSRCLILKGQM
ncbi:hypothetical protein EAF00_008249 [Botryotinia globosa]|nr:hypothetical protein EAF00_008249 [Botryotinia globosa]